MGGPPGTGVPAGCPEKGVWGGDTGGAVTDVAVPAEVLERGALLAEAVLGAVGGGRAGAGAARGPRRGGHELLDSARGGPRVSAAAHPVHGGRGAAAQRRLHLPEPAQRLQQRRRAPHAPRHGAGLRYRSPIFSEPGTRGQPSHPSPPAPPNRPGSPGAVPLGLAPGVGVFFAGVRPLAALDGGIDRTEPRQPRKPAASRPVSATVWPAGLGK
uniref:Uncharacterized protein n=1 Tax=Melopsittacus undulatus TaxID=13146 RepID=A0A8V5HF46_MELUD